MGLAMRYGISAAALIVQNNQVLLVNHRVAGQFDFWLPPGGRLEGEESIFECVKRESFEETGLTVEPERILYIQEFAEPDYHFCKFFILCSLSAARRPLPSARQRKAFCGAHFFARTNWISTFARRSSKANSGLMLNQRIHRHSIGAETIEMRGHGTVRTDFVMGLKAARRLSHGPDVLEERS
jgi:ADP-ribose pyrophosphatase YjhB (NUDIX family)